MANPNIVNVTSIYGKTNVLAVTTALTDIVANAAASGAVVKVNSLIVANIDGANVAEINASIYRNSTSYPFASTVPVPADATLIMIDKNSAIYLEEGDSIQVSSNADNDIVATCSYEIIS